MKTFIASLIGIFIATSSFTADKADKAKINRIENLVAVFDLDVTPPVDAKISRPLSDSIKREIVKSGKYEVMERGTMDKVLKEQAFQMSGCVAKECAVEAGQMLGAGKVVVGSVSQIGKTYLLSLSLVNVESGRVEAVEDQECKCEIDDLIKLSRDVALKLMGLSVAQPPKIEATTPDRPTEGHLTVTLYVTPSKSCDMTLSYNLYIDEELVSETGVYGSNGFDETIYNQTFPLGEHKLRMKVTEPNSIYGPLSMGKLERNFTAKSNTNISINSDPLCLPLSMSRAGLSVEVSSKQAQDARIKRK